MIEVDNINYNEKDYDLVNNELDVIKTKGKKLDEQIDENFIRKKNEDEKDPEFNFMKEENNKSIEKEMNSEKDQYVLPIDKFVDAEGEEVMPVVLPYETIDIIFNRNNIFANYQYFDPTSCLYDIYDTNRWRPFIDLNIYSSETDKAKKKYGMEILSLFIPWRILDRL